MDNIKDTKISKSKIVLIDDDKFLAKMYGSYFEKAGFEVKTYEDVPDNLVEEVAKEKPDIISMDILMPKMDGFTATKLLKANKRTSHIPIFGLSNFGDKETFERAKKVGMEKYFVTSQTTPQEYIQNVIWQTLLLRKLGLGITNENLRKIDVEKL